MFNNNEIGKRIALKRKENGYTQERLSLLLNVTPQAVSKWENGNALPDTALLPLLGKLLGVSIDRLLTGNNLLETEQVSPYDKEYEKEEYYWGLQHSILAEQVVRIMQGDNTQEKRILDIGSGEGRDSVLFAKCGYIVDSLELSRPGVEKIKHYSQVTGCNINIIHANMIDYDITEFYDVVYSMGSLQFLPPEQRGKHFHKYKQHTRTGGVNAHLVFVEKPFIGVAPDWQKNEYFYTSGDLARYYCDWEIMQCEEKIIDCNSANLPHQHAVNYFIARKV